ncbi:hypothetical protein OIE49_29530 [Streptomyces sp. NBC_01788]|uniref:hypothetical protein n=1 Tax=Streptomyces sp. NBC_01788 TaxID=2975940 RepID=UPI002DD91A74|nr:hypothetical protein [Streptomyces sp. NBC_01788]WSB29695.1 hypothetical protein OIE49_29530 [Streptomyces sp. NBC_01788]
MTSAIETYLGWQEPRHFADCRKPAWTVDYRTDDEFRDRRGGGKHACSNEDCGHGDRYPRTTVRIVCPSCQAAVVIRGEAHSINEDTTSTTTHGYGLPPRKLAGLLLWPGEPWLNVGRLGSADPYDFVVTRPGVKRVTEADVVGAITQSRGKRRAVTWSSAALPTPGRYSRFNWDRTNEDTLRTVAAAAKWIAAQLADRAAPAGGTPGA